MKSNLYQTTTFWVLASYLIFTAIQLIPGVGVTILFILMLIFGAVPFGLYVFCLISNLVFFAVVLDVIKGRMSKFALIIPIIFYGTYYAAYFYQGHFIVNSERKILSENAAQVLSYSPQTEALIIKGLYSSEDFVGAYKIPVLYEPAIAWTPGYFSYRLVEYKECDKEREYFHLILSHDQAGFGCKGVNKPNVVGYVDPVPNIAVFHMPEKPSVEKELVVSIKNPDHQSDRILAEYALAETVYSFSRDGKPIGIFKTAVIQRMPIFPFFFAGCGRNFYGSDDHWPDCFVSLYTDNKAYNLDVLPQGADAHLYGTNPIAIALKIPQYTLQELMSFHEDQNTVIAIDAGLKQKNLMREKNGSPR